MERWIKLHNNIIYNKIFQNSLLLKLFIYCLCKANYDEADWKGQKNFETVHLMPGEFITSYRHIAADIGATESSAYRWMRQLEKDGCVKINGNARYTKITVVNWALYQGDSENVKHKRNTDETLMKNKRNTDENSNRNNRNIQNKKEKKENSISPFGEGDYG